MVITGTGITAYNTAAPVVITRLNGTQFTYTIGSSGNGTGTTGTVNSNRVTITTSSPITGLTAGNPTIIVGLTPNEYNGTFIISTVPDSTHFTYINTDNPQDINGFLVEFYNLARSVKSASELHGAALSDITNFEQLDFRGGFLNELKNHVPVATRNTINAASTTRLPSMGIPHTNLSVSGRGFIFGVAPVADGCPKCRHAEHPAAVGHQRAAALCCRSMKYHPILPILQRVRNELLDVVRQLPKNLRFGRARIFVHVYILGLGVVLPVPAWGNPGRPVLSVPWPG